MTQQKRFRTAMAKYLGQAITPEIAAAIEVEAFTQPDESIDPSRFELQEANGLTFQVERFDEALPELHKLHVQHWAETERFRHGLALKPNYGHMEAAQHTGNLLQLTARRAGALVGNIRLYLYDDLHTGTKAAREDTFYMAPQERQGLAAIRFWKYAERCLSQLDVREVRTDSKILKDADGNVIRNVGRLNERLGYTHIANQYCKFLNQGE